MTLQLNSKQRRFLKQESHHLRPVLQIGKDAITQPFLDELSKQLEIHELLKVRILSNCLEEWSEMAPEMDKVNASVVQKVGHVVTLFRQREEESNFRL